MKKKHRQTVYSIMRYHPNKGGLAVVATCETPELADNLKDDFKQRLIDVGETQWEFIIHANTFYEN